MNYWIDSTATSEVNAVSGLYSKFVAFFILAVAFLDLGNYFEVLTEGSLLPKYVYYFLLIIIAPLVVNDFPSFSKYIKTIFASLLLAFVALNLLHYLYLIISGYYNQASLTITRVNYLFIIFFFVYGLNYVNRRIIGRIAFFLILLVVILQLFDFFQPGILYPIGTPGAPAGRASSTFINPNKVSESLLLLVLFSLPWVKSSLRIWLTCFAFIGIFLSFSRAGIFGWILFFIGAIIFRIFPRKSIFYFTILFLPLFFITILFCGEFLLDKELFLDVGIGRLEYALGLSTDINPDLYYAEQDNVNERKYVLIYAIDEFLNNPIFGNGAIHTQLWPKFPDNGPHNQHFLILVEYGVLGYLLVLALGYYLVKYRRYFNTVNVAPLMVGLLLYFSFFTHNMIDNLYWPLSIGLISLADIKNRRAYK